MPMKLNPCIKFKYKLTYKYSICYLHAIILDRGMDWYWVGRSHVKNEK